MKNKNNHIIKEFTSKTSPEMREKNSLCEKLLQSL